mmetsp:Transcript_10568/g.23310  ORF Transcript_10568/g.23310 Transcript_10568/m.23310 type:complete len:259 (+) Transcript_10568:116-892(+)|eukprot:CAMPEP_0204392556 /NCGR_PEP_ID=MMETSP0469-20131031/61821_1 /ASSEMBLY_ACC=CAM_ASM_000384 /TAXON_ID=2969 /ORGANISM="Oxyrrhis marina" /LENGTH=258 /DNA_ID=CAMNT_0051386537 /DNA_START=110 /DNA_END=882 /DNA_ORIENTATION=+
MALFWLLSALAAADVAGTWRASPRLVLSRQRAMQSHFAGLRGDQVAESFTAAQADDKPLDQAACDKLKGMIGDPAQQCLLMTYVAGKPEGCECRLKAGKCPFQGAPGTHELVGPPKAALKMTGLQPSAPFSFPGMGGTTLIMCMYWKYDGAAVDEAAAAIINEQHAKTVTDLVTQAEQMAFENSKAISDELWAGTPTPAARGTTTWPPTTTIAWTTTATVAPTTTAAPTTTTPEPTTTAGATTTGAGPMVLLSRFSQL